MSLNQKLNPNRFPGMSPKMAAIVGYIIGQQFTDPEIVDMIVTSDGYVMGMHLGDIGYNNFIGSKSDLEENWNNLLQVADLTETEMTLAKTFYRLRIKEC